MKNNIRPFEAGDWDDVNRIFKQGLDTNLAMLQTTSPTFKEWDASHLKACRYVCTSDGNLAGWVALTPVSNRCVYAGVAEISVYISEDMRGKGIGTMLLQKAIASSEKSSIWTLQSEIIQENDASIALHKKCGFREVGYREKIAKDSFGVWRNIVLMERRSNLDIFDCCCNSK